MKIKITESQARRVKILTEGVDAVSELERFIKIKNDELNKIYNIVTNISLAELISEQFDYKKLEERLDDIYNNAIRLNNHAMHEINKMDDDTGADMQLKVDDMLSPFKNKIWANQELIGKLDALRYHYDEENLGELFKDAGPIEIG